MSETRESRMSLAHTQEFQQAVAEEVAKCMAAMSVSQAPPATAEPGTALGMNERGWAESLAMAFAKLSSQNDGRVYIDPGILRARDEARTQMFELINSANSVKAPATYELTKKMVLIGDRGPELIEPLWRDPGTKAARNTVIDWNGVPNATMVPINGTAKAIHAAFMTSIGNLEKFEPEQAVALTAKGRVVSGTAVQRRQEMPEPEKNSSGAFRVHHQGQAGGIVEQHILGTIAAPALIQT